MPLPLAGDSQSTQTEDVSPGYGPHSPKSFRARAVLRADQQKSKYLRLVWGPATSLSPLIAYLLICSLMILQSCIS